INSVPHMSFVEGKDNVNFLKKRVEKLVQNPLFEGMEISDDYEVLKEWVPLMMEGRNPSEEIAVTKIESGTDIDYGSLTEKLVDNITEKGVSLLYKHEEEKNLIQ